MIRSIVYAIVGIDFIEAVNCMFIKFVTHIDI